MSVGRKSAGKASSVPAGLFRGTITSVMVTLAMTALMAVLLNRESISWEAAGYGILIMVMLSSYLGAVVSYRMIHRQKLLICLMSGLIYFGILLSITALFFGGKYEAVGVTGLLIVGGSTCAALLGTASERGGNRRGKRKYR